jgi:hypothetical protein
MAQGPEPIAGVLVSTTGVPFTTPSTNGRQRGRHTRTRRARERPLGSGAGGLAETQRHGIAFIRGGNATAAHASSSSAAKAIKTTRLRFVKIDNSMGRRMRAVGNEGRLACGAEPMLDVRRQHESDAGCE